MKRSWIHPLLTSMVLAACSVSTAETTITTTSTSAAAPTFTEGTTTTVAETTTTEAEPVVGTTDNPIELLFVPSVEADVIVAGGKVMKEALEEATGLIFEVSVPTSYAATVEEMCDAPDRTIGFIPGLGYVLASNLCGVDVAFTAVRSGFDVYWAQFLVPRDSEIDSLADLAGLTWAHPELGSTSGYMLPLLELEEAGVEPGANIEAGDHRQAALAVYRGDADFATSFYSPPLWPEGEWEEGDDPDIPDEAMADCAVTPNDELWCRGYQVLDARALARAEAPDIVQKVRILSITQGIPNESLSFGPHFPTDLRAQIEEALVAFAGTPAWNDSIGNEDFYGWDALSPGEDSEYDSLRMIVDLLGITLDSV